MRKHRNVDENKERRGQLQCSKRIDGMENTGEKKRLKRVTKVREEKEHEMNEAQEINDENPHFQGLGSEAITNVRIIECGGVLREMSGLKGSKVIPFSLV